MFSNRIVFLLLAFLHFHLCNFTDATNEVERKKEKNIVGQPSSFEEIEAKQKQQQIPNENEDQNKMWLRHQGWRKAVNVYKFVKTISQKIKNKKAIRGKNGAKSSLVIGIENPKFWGHLCSRPREFRKLMRAAIKYSFTDVRAARREEMLDKILKGINCGKREAEKGLGNFGKKLAENLFDWYWSLDLEVGGPDIGGYPMAYGEHMKAKAELVTIPIAQGILGGMAYERVNSIKREYGGMDGGGKIKVAKNVKIRLYDVGTGDGELSMEIHNNLRERGFTNLDMALIDIDDKIDWNAAASACQDGQKGIEGDWPKLRQLLYNGRDLGLKIREDLKRKENAKKIDRMSREVIVVTYNHSLHHWPNLEGQMESIRQLGEILPLDSIVILKEHYNLLNDAQISLNHLLINFRNNLFHYPTEGAEKCAKKRERESAIELLDEYVRESGAHNYLSPFILMGIMEANGFKLFKFTDEKADDSDRTVVYAFKKIWQKSIDLLDNGKGEENEKDLKQKAKKEIHVPAKKVGNGLDDGDALQILKELKMKKMGKGR